MSVLLWVLFGGLVGWIASIFMGTNSRQGIFLNIALGVVGAVVGGFLMSLIGQPGVTGFNFYSFLVALVGAVVVLYLGKLIHFPR